MNTCLRLATILRPTIVQRVAQVIERSLLERAEVQRRTHVFAIQDMVELAMVHNV